VAKVELSIDNRTTWVLATGMTSWAATLSLPENTVIIWVRVTDVAGDTNITSVSVEVDTTPPTGSVVINENEPFSTGMYVVLTLNATDRYGIQSMMISNSPDFNDSSWDDYSPTATWQLSAGDGLKTVYVKYRDTNGWESKVYSDSILLDTTPPTGSIHIDDGAEYTRNSTVTLSLNATDPSGLNGMMVSNTPDFLGAQWTDYKESMPWALGPDSLVRTVYVKFRDMGEHISQACSDSIIEDLISPTVTVMINGGAPYTESRNVTVELRPVENNVVAVMQVREGDGSFTGNQPWVALLTNTTLTLSAGEGTKTVSARLMDAAGNIGASASSSILYDSTSPTTKLGIIPETSPRAKVTVSWNATDATSGVLWYDVQSRAGDGSWTDWLTHVNQTSAAFTGDDLQTYQFRARAEDRAGNLEDFPATVDNSVIIQLSEPLVTFILPKEGATLSGKATFNGTCQLVADGRNVSRVEFRVDNGTWQNADELLIWGFKLDTTKLKDGKHVVQVRTFDGAHYSTEVERQFKVSNAKAKSFLGADGLLLFALAVAMAIGFVARRRIGSR
jgi:hypothetical protein